ncbi:MAG: nucleotidyl transferase AbiEii/AbiGii toxin family protein [Smithellaceae bacterium]
MISKDTLQPEWINKASAENRKADKILIEKVIRALLLLEGLAQSDLPFIFKGGSSVMLLQQMPRRFSIDIDIIVPEKADFDAHFTRFIQAKNFTRFEVQKRNTSSNIEKHHYKFFYAPVHQKNIAEDNILLDILIEQSPYRKIIPTDIDLPFVQQDGAPLQVNIPGKEDILGDKLTAFAPNTTGIPYEKSGVSMAMEIIKQLYDIGNLFEEISDIKTIAETFQNIAQTEMKYRKLPGDVKNVLDDILNTTLCLATRGKSGKGDFDALQKGISQIKAYIFSESYHIETAIVHAARAAYLAKLIETGAGKFIRFENAQQIIDWQIEAPLDTKLNKLKKSNPEAFFYWYQIYLLERKAGEE